MLTTIHNAHEPNNPLVYLIDFHDNHTLQRSLLATFSETWTILQHFMDTSTGGHNSKLELTAAEANLTLNERTRYSGRWLHLLDRRKRPACCASTWHTATLPTYSVATSGSSHVGTVSSLIPDLALHCHSHCVRLLSSCTKSTADWRWVATLDLY